MLAEPFMSTWILIVVVALVVGWRLPQLWRMSRGGR
jgi:hypothetical protein